MRVLLKLRLDCEPDTVWDKLHDPSVFAQVMAPLMTAQSKEVGGFPPRWLPGEHVIALKLFGLIPVGRQSVRLSERNGTASGIRVLRDTGIGLSGPLAMMTGWDHRMALSETSDGRTLYRDQLRVRAGWLTPLAWPGLWLFWQWRGRQLRRFASDW
ncbi:MAG TPA: hypothetical protein VK139_05075 [Microbacteriaceae bacterium]|nr:hypothetical protein [Microbacteriaceae bacterium]